MRFIRGIKSNMTVISQTAKSTLKQVITNQKCIHWTSQLSADEYNLLRDLNHEMAGNVKSTKLWFLFGGDRHHFSVIFGPNESFRKQNVKVNL